MEGQEIDDTVDEFAFPLSPPPQGEGEGKSRGELLTHSFQAKETKTKEEKDRELQEKFGDLEDRAAQKCRIYFERIFAMDRAKLNAVFLSPPPQRGASDEAAGEGEKQIPLGVNSRAGYVLEGPADMIDFYLDRLREEEQRSVSAGLIYALKQLKVASVAKAKLAYVRALMEHDQDLKPLLAKYENGFCKKAVKLAIKEKKAGDMVDPQKLREAEKFTLDERPNKGELPKIKFVHSSFTSPPEVGEANEEYTIHTGPVPGFGSWVSDLKFKVPENVMPSCAFNDAYFAVVIGHPLLDKEGCLDGLVFTIQGYPLQSDTGLILHRKPIVLSFSLPLGESENDRTFDINLATLVRLKFQDGKGSKLGIGISNGVIVVDLANKDWAPRVACFSPIGEKITRIVTSLCIPVAGDRVILSTSYGESCGVSLETGKILNYDLTPAVESVLHTIYSNHRLILQTATSICGDFTPFLTTGGELTHLEVIRPLCTVVLGTQIYVLEKYGRVFVFNTLIRGLLAPFNPPSSPGGEEREYGLGLPVPHSYQALAAGPDSLMVMYPNGLVARYAVAAKHRNDIETYVLRGKIPKQKLTKKQKKLVKLAKEKKKNGNKK